MNTEHRRAVSLLADSPDGLTLDMLVFEYGFSVALLDAIVKAGHATATEESAIAKSRPWPLTIMRYRITPAGREAISN